MFALALVVGFQIAEASSPWAQVTTWTATSPGDSPSRRPPDSFGAPVGAVTVTLNVPGTPAGQAGAWLHIYAWRAGDGFITCDGTGVAVSAAYATNPWTDRATEPELVYGPRLPLPDPEDPWPALRLEISAARPTVCWVTLTPHDRG